MNGGNGPDTVRGGGGDDVLVPDDNVDRVIGGPGEDAVNYRVDYTKDTNTLHRKMVNVDLAAGRAWGGFGPDRLTGVEDAVSGNGRDVLRGDGRRPRRRRRALRRCEAGTGAAARRAEPWPTAAEGTGLAPVVPG